MSVFKALFKRRGRKTKKEVPNNGCTFLDTKLRNAISVTDLIEGYKHVDERNIKHEAAKIRVFGSCDNLQHTSISTEHSDITGLTELLSYIRDSEIGKDEVIEGPFGRKRIMYADYTASGRALTFIEEFIRAEVLPCYANTHTTASVTGYQTTSFREEARTIIKKAVNASQDDIVLFVGNGTTAAVHLLVHSLNLQKQRRPVVITGPYEHHSNLLPWRESGAEVVMTKVTTKGLLDMNHLERLLQSYSNAGCCIYGAFNAVSNVTGLLTDTRTVTALIHKYGGYSFWDYAAGAPYVDIDMNPVSFNKGNLLYKDAIYFSMHKFVGGINSPGILVAKRHIFQSTKPVITGGGTVSFVTGSNHRYLLKIEEREEGGTPAIVGCIRAGLAFQVKQAVGSSIILHRESEILRKVLKAWINIKELEILGPLDVPRIPIFSFLIKHPESGHYLHHNFICMVLNDLFGIQARGGCMCAGPYGMLLLHINQDLADKYQELILDYDVPLGNEKTTDRDILKPGYTRLSFPYFASDEFVDYIINAVILVAKHGWKLLPQYDINENGSFVNAFHHQTYRVKRLENIVYSNGKMEYISKPQGPPPSSKVCLAYAEEYLITAATMDLPQVSSYRLEDLVDQCLVSRKEKQLRWFLMPNEALDYLKTRSDDFLSPKLGPGCSQEVVIHFADDH